jgi:hypothetical protein
MTCRPIAPLLLVLAGCPSDPNVNPKVLWLAPENGELNVKLVDQQPHPF